MVLLFLLYSIFIKGIENKVFDRNIEFFFEELFLVGLGLIGDVDEGVDLLGMIVYLKKYYIVLKKIF